MRRRQKPAREAIFFTATSPYSIVLQYMHTMSACKKSLLQMGDTHEERALDGVRRPLAKPVSFVTNACPLAAHSRRAFLVRGSSEVPRSSRRRAAGDITHHIAGFHDANDGMPAHTLSRSR